jgi:hypothetical protein
VSTGWAGSYVPKQRRTLGARWTMDPPFLFLAVVFLILFFLNLLFLFLSTASNHAGNGRRRAPGKWRAAHDREPRCAVPKR